MRVVEYTQTDTALGGQVLIGFVSSADNATVADLFRTLWLAVFQFEKRFSRFLTASELSRFNRRAGTEVPISDEFRDILQQASHLAVVTQGLYNPFVLPALHETGYVASALRQYAANQPDDYSRRSGAPITDLVVKHGHALIPYNTAIDLGGCGKGYLADQLGRILRDAHVEGYWIELSGDVATYGRDAEGHAIHVAIDGSDFVIRTPSTPFGIGTSGTKPRPGQTLKGHHIIDPRTLKPADSDVYYATVCAASAVLADVLASCAIIVGSKQAPQFLQQLGATDWQLRVVSSSGVEKLVTHGTHIRQLKEAIHA